MKPGDRQAGIVLAVERDGEATVQDLCARFNVSAETIRRDLTLLAETGALQKVHGGARRIRLHVESSFEERMSEQAGGKVAIAQKLRRLIAPGDTCFIDTGTTTLASAKALAEVPDLTIITNSLRIARVMAHGAGHARVFLLGGIYAPDNGETVGPDALAQIAQFHADYAIIGVAGLDAALGPMDANFDEAAIARAMCNHARKIIVLAGSAKYGKRAAHRVCALEDMDVLVCDEPPGEGLRQALEAADVKIV